MQLNENELVLVKRNFGWICKQTIIYGKQCNRYNHLFLLWFLIYFKRRFDFVHNFAGALLCVLATAHCPHFFEVFLISSIISVFYRLFGYKRMPFYLLTPYSMNTAANKDDKSLPFIQRQSNFTPLDKVIKPNVSLCFFHRDNPVFLLEMMKEKCKNFFLLMGKEHS